MLVGPFNPQTWAKPCRDLRTHLASTASQPQNLPHTPVWPFLDLRWQFPVLENITRNLKIIMEKESQNAQRHGWCLPPLNLAWGISYVQTFYILPSLCLGFACSPASSPSFREICLFPKDNKVVHIEPQCPSSLGAPLVLLAPPQIVWLPAQAHLWAEAPCALEHPATRTLPAVVPQQEPRARAARAGQGSGHWYSVPASVPE